MKLYLLASLIIQLYAQDKTTRLFNNLSDIKVKKIEYRKIIFEATFNKDFFCGFEKTHSQYESKTLHSTLLNSSFTPTHELFSFERNELSHYNHTTNNIHTTFLTSEQTAILIKILLANIKEFENFKVLNQSQYGSNLLNFLGRLEQSQESFRNYNNDINFMYQIYENNKPEKIISITENDSQSSFSSNDSGLISPDNSKSLISTKTAKSSLNFSDGNCDLSDLDSI